MASRRALQGQLECPVCLDTYTRPRMLPCQHTFCEECVQRVAENSNNNRVKCPECNREFPIPNEGFSPSIPIQRLLEARQQLGSLTSTPSFSSLRPSQMQSSPTNSSVLSDDRFDRRQQPIALNSAENSIERNPVIVAVNPTIFAATTYNGQTNNRTISTRAIRIETSHRQSQVHPSDNTSDNTDDRESRSGITGLGKVVGHGGNLIGDWANFTSKNCSKAGLLGFDFIILLSTVGKLIAGAVVVNSDCPLESQVALFLLVKACISSILFWTIFVLFQIYRKDDAGKIRVFQVYLIADGIFSMTWQFLGVYWLMSKYYIILEECPKYDSSWNFHFTNFAMFITSVDLFLILYYLTYCCYKICK